MLQISEHFKDRVPVFERIHRPFPKSPRQIMRRLDAAGPQATYLRCHPAAMLQEKLDAGRVIAESLPMRGENPLDIEPRQILQGSPKLGQRAAFGVPFQMRRPRLEKLIARQQDFRLGQVEAQSAVSARMCRFILEGCPKSLSGFQLTIAKVFVA